MNRPNEPAYHNKSAYKHVFPNHIHNEKGKLLDEDCSVCMQNEKRKEKYDNKRRKRTVIRNDG